jgi:hypothetical protein
MPTGKNSCNRLAVAFTLDQVGAHRSLTGVPGAGDGGAAYHVRARRLEAEFLPIAVFDLANRAALAARCHFRLARLLRAPARRRGLLCIGKARQHQDRQCCLG